MRRAMMTWAPVLLAGLVVLTLHPIFIPMSAGAAAGFGAAVLIPLGYLPALIGAAGPFVGW